MYDDHDRSATAGASPEQLDSHQRGALFRAQLHVLPEDWSRARATWRDFGRLLRDDDAAIHGAAA